MRRFLQVLTLALAPVGASACTASLSLDRFTKDDAPLTTDTSTIKYFDVQFNAKNMQSHIAEYFEIRVVDKDNAVQMKAVYSNVTKPDFSLYMSRIVPKTKAPYRLDFWADHNNSLKYDGIVGGINDKDHAWRRVLADPLPEDVRLAGKLYTVDFIHDTAFVDIATDLLGNPISTDDVLLPLNLKIVGAGAYVGKMMEVRVVDAGAGRLLALHREGSASDTYTARVLGVIDDTSPYEVSVYVDVNGDEKFNAGEPSWKLNLTSDKNGLVSELNVSTTPQTPIDTGQP
ncbi:MAG TPA: hypothetical protein VLT33_22050 [Labilithrix sp.]|nr:hypothetical protein [Labilithrix sp.]